MNRFQVAAVLPILFAGFPATAGLEETTGREPGIWGKGGISVVAARIRKVTELRDDRHATHVLVIEPIATLAGAFDPTEKASLEARVWADRATSSIDEIPFEGDFVLAVLYYDSSHDVVRVTADICTFMPGRSALVQITGLDDLRVSETLKRIREARASAVEREKREAEQRRKE